MTDTTLTAAADVERLRALSEAATPGFIRLPPMSTDLRAEGLAGAPIGMTNPSGTGNGINDREFIAACWNHVRAILAVPTPPARDERAIAALRDAVAFFDRVKGATEAEKIAVGTDHWVWLEAAARRVASLPPAPSPDKEPT